MSRTSLFPKSEIVIIILWLKSEVDRCTDDATWVFDSLKLSFVD